MGAIVRRLKTLIYSLMVISVALALVGFKTLYDIQNPPIVSCGVADMDVVVHPPEFSSDALNGKKLFKANCNSCHILGRNMTGPNLIGVEDRWEDKDRLYQWIKHPQEALKNDDPYINAMFEEWSKKSGIMPAQPVSDEEIDQILQYIQQWVDVSVIAGP